MNEKEGKKYRKPNISAFKSKFQNEKEKKREGERIKEREIVKGWAGMERIF